MGTNETEIQSQLLEIREIGYLDELSAKAPVQGGQFRKVDIILSDLLEAACGLQGRFRDDGGEPDFLMSSMGKHIQRLRNDLAIELEPIFEAFGVEAVDY